MLGASLTEPLDGKAPSDRLALKPYRGKPDVRNFRRAMETSASFEARSAPSLYPANLPVRLWGGAGEGNLPAYSTNL
jgi:hypothetical protein